MDKRRISRGFSLLEVVIVVAIIAILAAIGIPRMSRGSRGAGDSALRADLAVLRNAIDLYAAEHQGTYPTTSGIVNQLTQYTDSSGAVSASKTTTHIYGPYIRDIPTLPVGSHKGDSGIADANAAGVGWIYVSTTGSIKSNTVASEQDDTEKAYSDY